MAKYDGPLVWFVFSPECFDSLVNSMDFGDIACMKFVLNRLISYAIIVGAAVVKVPQILNILVAGSAKGLSINAIYLETVGTLAGTLYNVLLGNPFRTYGETALILVQNIFLVLLCWAKTTPKPSTSSMMKAATVFVAIAALLWNVHLVEPYWPKQLADEGMSVMDGMYSLMTALFIAARLPQIVQNYQQGHTGVLSLLTLIMNVGGNVARIGTTIAEGLAPVVLYSFILNAVLNIILLLQVLMYWGATKKALAKQSGKKKD